MASSKPGRYFKFSSGSSSNEQGKGALKRAIGAAGAIGSKIRSMRNKPIGTAKSASKSGQSPGMPKSR